MNKTLFKFDLYKQNIFEETSIFIKTKLDISDISLFLGPTCFVLVKANESS